MGRKFLTRYLILVAVLVVCAGVAWYVRTSAENPKEGAVLARAAEQKKVHAEDCRENTALTCAGQEAAL